MKIARLPENEPARLKALSSYQLMDSEQEQDYDNLALLAAEICQTPVALITLIGEQRQWFKSRYGTELTENHRDYTFCSHAILDGQEIMIVDDARTDSRFSDNPMVTGEHKVVFYAGVPLVNSEGYALGSICVIGNEKKQLTDSQIRALKILGRQALQLMELRRKAVEYEKVNKELADSNSFIQRFAERVAHDIKNPLGNIMITLQALAAKTKKTGDESYSRLIELSFNSSKNLLNYVNELLVNSKLSADLNRNHDTFSLSALLKEVLEMLSIPENYKIKLPADVDLSCSRVALEQMLLNLLSNAVRYNDKADPEIEVTFEQTDSGYSFTVCDNGIGMSAEIQEHIFDHGYCAGIPDRFQKKGNGIGLGAVKSQVERLNGRIKVESVEGEGSGFFVYLPKV